MSEHIPLKKLFDYERGQLSHDHDAVIMEHLATCAHCAENMKLFHQPHRAQTNGFATAPAHHAEKEDDCPSPEDIGRFINNELPKRQQQDVEKHLALCDTCRRQLVAIVQASFEPVSEEEKSLLEALPPFEISEQVNAIKRLMPDKPRLLDKIRNLPDRLGLLVPKFGVPRPAWALAVVLVLGLAGKWWAWPTYKYYRLASQGESRLLEQNRIYYRDTPRLSHGFLSSPIAERLGPEEEKQTIDTLLKQALRYRPQDETAQLRLAQYFLLQERYDSSDSLLKLLEAASPRNAAVLNDRGNWFYQQKQFEAAAASFQRAWELNPRLDEALYNLAVTLTRLGDTAKARTSWEKYIALDNIKAEWRNAAKVQLQALETK
jgi:anti-sigma factor RsiW